MSQLSIYLSSVKETEHLGRRLASVCSGSTVIFLQGDLGAGKTTLVRGFLSDLGYTGPVKSPTYTLVEPYQVNGKTVFHFDFYRLENTSELVSIGIREYFAAEAVCLVEWPEKGGDQLPSPDLHCVLEIKNEGRQATLVAHSPRGEAMLDHLKKGPNR